MGSGDPSGLQNRRELASLALVSSTLTRFRQFSIFRGFEAKPGSWRDYDAIQVRQSFTSFIGPPGYRTEGMPIAAAAPHQKSNGFQLQRSSGESSGTTQFLGDNIYSGTAILLRSPPAKAA